VRQLKRHKYLLQEVIMTSYREVLRLSAQGISQRGIARSCSCSRNTVARVLAQAQQQKIAWSAVQNLAEGDLYPLLFPNQAQPILRKAPDCEYIHREMARSGVTLSLLWNEYCDECRSNNEIPLGYTQYCNYYRKFAVTTKATMHISRKPGEQTEVDWAGSQANLIDRDSGEIIPAYIFVAVLSCSQYTYVEAFLKQDLECWIAAHVSAFEFFGGVTRIVTPDNLKTGVTQASWYNPVINKTYHEMAEHYGTAIIPARVRKPQDKPNAEGAVGVISTWILAALRHCQFFSLTELNEAIREKLDIFNHNPFQKKAGSRLSAFLEEERAALQPLPVSPYELAIWRIATVQFNYHITIEKMHYSVPYEYIKQPVEVRITRQVIEIYFHNHRICSHPRLYGREGQYSTMTEHMPEDHQQYVAWNGERFISWAEKVGPHTAAAIKAILAGHKIEPQGYRACMALLKLADRYSVIRLESACARALSYTPSPSYKNISTILKSGQDKLNPAELALPVKEEVNPHGFTRGADYYRRQSE
jgi:transposase